MKARMSDVLILNYSVLKGVHFKQHISHVDGLFLVLVAKIKGKCYSYYQFVFTSLIMDTLSVWEVGIKLISRTRWWLWSRLHLPMPCAPGIPEAVHILLKISVQEYSWKTYWLALFFKKMIPLLNNDLRPFLIFKIIMSTQRIDLSYLERELVLPTYNTSWAYSP